MGNLCFSSKATEVNNPLLYRNLAKIHRSRLRLIDHHIEFSDSSDDEKKLSCVKFSPSHTDNFADDSSSSDDDYESM